MYQQIQGLSTEEKGLEIRYEHAKSIQQNVRFECQTISENIQKLKQEEFKDIQVLLYKFKALNFCFQIQGHSRTFKFCTNPV